MQTLVELQPTASSARGFMEKHGNLGLLAQTRPVPSERMTGFSLS